MSERDHTTHERKVDQLIDAVYRNDANSVRLLLRAGVDPAARDSLALQVAAADGRVEIVKLLVEDGRSNVEAFHCFAVRWAARGAHLEVLELLDWRRSARCWPAATDGFVLGGVAAVEAMLSSRVFNVKFHQFVLGRAALHGNDDVVERLQRDERMLRTGISPLSTDCCKTRASIRRQMTTVLSASAQNGHTAVVERLLRDIRVDPTANDSTAIHLAARHGHHDVVEVLMRDARSAAMWRCLASQLAVTRAIWSSFCATSASTHRRTKIARFYGG
jgi:hypothetical protein